MKYALTALAAIFILAPSTAVAQGFYNNDLYPDNGSATSLSGTAVGDIDMGGFRLHDSTDELNFGTAAEATYATGAGHAVFGGKLEVKLGAHFISGGTFYNTLLISNNFGMSIGSSRIMYRASTQTPDSVVWEPGTASDCVVFAEFGDAGTDLLNDCTANGGPTIVLQSNDATTVTDRLKFYHDQTDGVIDTDSGGLMLSPSNGTLYQGLEKDLTDGVATAFVRIAVPQGSHKDATITYSIHADDAGGDLQLLQGRVSFAAINKTGTETCDAQKASAAEAYAESSGPSTLTVAFTCASNAADTVDVLANANTSLTPTTLEIHYSLLMSESTTVTPQ